MSLKDGRRCVARPLQNLGSTCFVNCVLQALAHAPELCMAVDTQPHAAVCPIAAENAAMSAASTSFATTNPTKSGNKRTGTVSSNSSASSSASLDDPAAAGTRRSSRGKSKGGGTAVAAAAALGGRKSPSSDQDSQRSNSNSKHKYCVLCELERHFALVHDSTRRDKPLAPSTFVKGFLEHVAPWFKLGTQEDAHEFLRLLIDAMQKSCQQARLQINPQDDAEASAAVSAAATSTAAADDDNSNERDDDDASDANPPVPSISISSGTVSKDDKEYPFALFRGMVESRVICAACQTSSATLDPIEDVGLDVSLDHPSGGEGSTATSTRASRNASPLLPHGNANLADVKSAFERFARVELVDGYKCEKCGCTGRATKQSKLASIPPILTLHLKRFRYGDSRLLSTSGMGSGGAATSASYGSSFNGAGGGYSAPTVTTRSSRSGRSEVNQLSNSDFVLGGKSGSAKIEGHVKFDLFFDLKPYLTPDMQTSETSSFCRLFAVIVHAGKNSHSGHYIAYVQSLNKNEWWKMDDGRVTLVDKTDVLRAEAYMLFYRVIQHPVATSLSGAYDRWLDSQRAAPVQPASAPTGAQQLSSNSNGRAKRSRSSSSSSFRDGEEWARAKAPRLVGVATKAQEVVAEALELTSEFLQRIQDEVSREDFRDDANEGTAAAAAGPKTTTIGEKDVVGGVAVVRQRVTDLFYRLAQLYDDGAAGSDTPRPVYLLDFIEGGGGGRNGGGNAADNDRRTRSKANPKALTTKAAVEPSDSRSSVVGVADLMDGDATDLL